MEAGHIVARLNLQLVNEASLVKLAIASGMGSKRANQEFKKTVDKLMKGE